MSPVGYLEIGVSLVRLFGDCVSPVGYLEIGVSPVGYLEIVYLR